MRVSVVICTYNRAEGLRATLECLRQQRFPDFEVVVVNGPSSDHTAAVITDYSGMVKVEHNTLANLSVSRNLGIRAAAGDIVAFIDDDALPELCWLDQALPSFEDDEVGGVGGIVFDHTGMELQYRYSAANRFGEATWSMDTAYDDLSVPGAFTFPYLQGTNALFRREVLSQVGLFDETFDYYLDETDVCCRIVDAGYVLRQLDVAPVHHKYLPSAVRNTERVITNWYPVVKNHTYFGYRHALHDAPELEVIDRARVFIDHLVDDTRRHEQMGKLPHGHTQLAIDASGQALAAGILLGRKRHPIRLGPEELPRSRFLRYQTIDASTRRNIVLVSSGFRPALTGGIARFISDVAPELAQRGHDVRVLTRSESASTVDFEDGVWVHRLEPATVPGRLADGPTHIDGFATAAADEVERIRSWWESDVAYGSLWDVELLGICRDGHVPVVPMLATPVAEVARHEGWDRADSPHYSTAQRLIELETELIRGATIVHAISDSIVETFEHLYEGLLDRERTLVAHIGRKDELEGRSVIPAATPPLILFVGRLEPRKGIDVFLQSAITILAEHRGARIVVAGDARRLGPDGVTYPVWWAKQAVRSGKMLEFVGDISDERLSSLLDEASVVVMPSRYESFGLVVVEAMMHGRPPVASAIGGIVELIDDGLNGILVPVDDAEALANAVVTLLDDPVWAADVGRRARDHFVRHLTSTAAASRLEHVLLSAIEAFAGEAAIA